MKCVVAMGEKDELWEFLDSANADDSRRVWLERHMSCELAIAAGMKGDWARAAHHCRQGYTRFIEVLWEAHLIRDRTITCV